MPASLPRIAGTQSGVIVVTLGSIKLAVAYPVARGS